MFERMLQKENQPSADELALYCGQNCERFRALNDILSEKFNTMQEIRFPYGKKYGWCITHRKGKKLICDVFAESGAFTVMMRLSDRQYQTVYPQLKDYSKHYIDNRYPCGDGGWIHYRVTNDEHLKDIKLLLNEKCR